MREAILCFLKRSDTLLLLTTQYPDKTVLNGVSGYIDEGETAPIAACREINEELGVLVEQSDLLLVGKHDIFTIFIVEKWAGEPTPKEESILNLEWFQIHELPYDRMHPGNQQWLSHHLTSQKEDIHED